MIEQQQQQQTEADQHMQNLQPEMSEETERKLEMRIAAEVWLVTAQETAIQKLRQSALQQKRIQQQQNIEKMRDEIQEQLRNKNERRETKMRNQSILDKLRM